MRLYFLAYLLYAFIFCIQKVEAEDNFIVDSPSPVIPENPEQIAQAIIEILKQYQIKIKKVPKNDQLLLLPKVGSQAIEERLLTHSPTQAEHIFAAIKGYDTLKKKIRVFVEKNQPISFIILGFHGKSTNIEQKTISFIPDLAERKSLEWLQSLLTNISKVYKPGATLNILCTGAAFGDVVGIKDEYILAYTESLKQLAADLRDIKVVGLEEFASSKHALYSLRAAIRRHEPTNAMLNYDLNHRILEDAKFASEWLEFRKSVAADFNHPYGQALLKKINKETEVAVREVFSRSIGMRRFLSQKIPNFSSLIHLSFHYYADVGKKIGVELTPNSQVIPWEGVALLKENGTIEVVYKEEAIRRGATLDGVIINGFFCFYYREKKK